MVLLTWTKEMSVGVSLLDSDHQALMNIINSLEETAHTAERRGNLEDHLQTLMQYTIKHFGREEKVMRACGYTALHSHLNEHFRFSDEILSLAGRIRRGNDSTSVRELFTYLRDWWNHHILIQDMAYRPYIESHQNANAVAREFPPLLAKTVDARSKERRRPDSHLTISRRG